MRYSVFFVLIFFSNGAFAQSSYDPLKISLWTKGIIDDLSTHQIVAADSMGLRVVPLPATYPTPVVRKNVPFAELRELTNHPNPVVRCYAFRSLNMISESEAFKIVIQHLYDTSIIKSLHGCFEHDESVGDFFIGVFRGHESKEKNDQHLKALDSLIVVTPNKLACRGEAAKRLGVDEVYYSSVRKIALEDGLYWALVALAKFQKEQDIEPLLNAEIKEPFFRSSSLNTRFMIIRAFPHSDFLPFLEQHLNRELLGITGHARYLYLALVNFSGRHAHDLLLKPFTIKNLEERTLHLQQLSVALETTTNPEFADIRKKLAAEKLN
jgi:hypothetical protein